MKRSLFIAVVVLLLAALFVSCNADKAIEDQLFEVTIDGGARALQATGVLDVQVEKLFWYYSAHKVSGFFKTGETAWKPVQSTAGIAGASLGSFSTGEWVFCFYGFTSAQTNAPSNPKAAAVYYQESLSQSISQAVALSLSLSKGALPQATIGFVEAGITWTYADAGADLDLEMEILDGTTAVEFDENVTRLPGTYDSESGSYVFTLSDTMILSKGTHTFTVRVYFENEVVGESEITIEAIDGMKYTVGGSVDVTEELVEVTIGSAEAPVVASTTVVIQGTEPTVVHTANTPAGTTNATTTVSFPAGALTQDTSLTVETSSFEVASTKGFAVTAGNTAVASISLALDDNTTSFNGKEVTITTFIEKGLDNVAVYYNGTGDAPTLVSYNATSGELVFKTTHFSEYYVTSKSVAKIGDKAYPTLTAALDAAQDGNTITLLQDANIWTTLGRGKSITIDMGDNVLSGAFDVYNGEVTLKNGTYALTDSTYLIGKGTEVSNFSVLTIEHDVTVTAGNDWPFVLWPCEASGEAGYGVVLNVYGTIDAHAYDSAIFVTGNVTGGNAEVNVFDGAVISSGDVGIALNGYATVNVEAGASITGFASAIEVRAGNLNIAGGTFTATSTIDPAESHANGSGTTTEGAAIAIAQHTTKLPINVVINGGTFTATCPLFESNPENNADADIEKIALEVNGGTFTANGEYAIYLEDYNIIDLSIVLDDISYNKDGLYIGPHGSVAPMIEEEEENE